MQLNILLNAMYMARHGMQPANLDTDDGKNWTSLIDNKTQIHWNYFKTCYSSLLGVREMDDKILKSCPDSPYSNK